MFLIRNALLYLHRRTNCPGKSEFNLFDNTTAAYQEYYSVVKKIHNYNSIFTYCIYGIFCLFKFAGASNIYTYKTRTFRIVLREKKFTDNISS